MFEPIVANLRDHVLKCPLCSAKGFICEICMNTDDIIFPFELNTTSVCQSKYFKNFIYHICFRYCLVCQSCFHLPCHESKKYQCPKCERNKSRK